MGSLLAALPLMAEVPFAAAVIRDGSRYLLQVPARPGELYCLEVPDVPGSTSFTSVPGTAVYAQSSTVSWPLELPGTVVLDQSAGTPSGEEPPAVGGTTLLVLTVEVADPPGSHVRLRAGGANPWTAVAPAAFPRVTFDGFADLPTANGVRCTALSARTLPEPIGESEPGRAQLSPEQQQEFDAVMAGFPQLIAAATLPPGLPPASGTPPTSPLTSSRYFRVAMYRVDTNGNGYADADELAIGSNPFARPGEPGFLPAASSADGTGTPGIAPIWDTDGDFSPDFEEIAAGTSPLLKYSAPVVLTCQKLDRWAIFNSAGSWREYEERFHGWEPVWWNGIPPEMLSGSPISMDPATTPRTLSGFMSDFAAGWSEFDVPSPDARKGLPPQSLFGEYLKPPPLIARRVSPRAGNPPATNGYIRAIGDRYMLRGPLSQGKQQRQFIKATWTQTEGFNQSHVPEYAAETLMEQPPATTEVITLTIPAGALYSPPYDVTPDAPDTPHTNVSDYLKVVRLLPVELYSDLNNDGELTSADGGLVGKPYASGASEAEKDKGTEFMFANDNLSNGAWDKEDTTPPGKPADADDDDAEAIFVGIGALPDETEVWLEHPASAGLKFYRDRKCTEEIPLSSSRPHVVGGSSAWPDDNIVFARAESVSFPDAANPQVEGDLKLMVKLGGAANGVEATKMKLTIIKGLGAKKYFHGARDYIFENNTRLFVHEKKYPSNSPSSTFRICVMREESTSLWPIETFYRNPQIAGIEAVVTAYPLTVLLNGNQVTFKDGTGSWAAAFIGALGTLGIGEGKLMTDICHGRIKERSAGTFSLSSSDNYDSTTTPMAGSVLAGPDPIPGTNPPEAGGKYVAQLSDDKWTFAAGVVPDNLTQAPFVKAALGGLSTYYDNSIRDTEPQQFVGYAPLDNTGKGCVFTASQISGGGHGVSFADDAKKSGVPNLPGGSKPSDLSLLILDSGDTSVAVAHANPAGTLKVIHKGAKQNGVPYFVNTYLGFYSEPPRP